MKNEEPSAEQIMDSLEESVAQVESAEALKKEEATMERQVLMEEDVDSPQTTSSKKDVEPAIEQQADSFDEFVTQVESAELPKKVKSTIEQQQETLQEFAMIQKEYDLLSPQSTNAVIVDVHVTSVFRDPIDSFSAPIENSASSSSDRALSVDKYDKHSSACPPPATGNVETSTVEEIKAPFINTYIPGEGSQHSSDTNAGSCEGSLDAYPSEEAVSPKGQEDTVSELEGGRLWHAAMREANMAAQLAQNRRKLPETLMERTRSRADVDAFVTPRTPISPKDGRSKYYFLSLMLSL
jgi:hypothetical protein